MKYKLSALENVNSGVTAVPNETIAGTIFTFRAKPPKPLIYAFSPRIEEKVCYYGPGNVGATFNRNGTGLVTYPDGEKAIEITDGRIGKRLVVYSQSGKDEKGIFHGNLPVAIFDNMGNGAVFDIEGNIRLNYDQGEGVLYETRSKIPLYWRWRNTRFLLKRKKDLEFATIDEPDNEVPDTPIDYDLLDEEEENKEMTKPGMKSRKSAVKKSRKSSAAPGSKKRKGSVKNNKNDATFKKRKSGRRISKEEPVGRNDLNSQKSYVSNLSNLSKTKGFQEQKQCTKDKTCKFPTCKEEMEPITEIKPLVIKIVKNITLKVQHQEHIHIDFLFIPVHFILNVGTRVYPENLERIDKIIRQPDDKYKVPSYFEFLHKRTLSLHNLHLKRIEMQEEAKKEQMKIQIKNAYIMGTFIYLRKKAVRESLNPQ